MGKATSPKSRPKKGTPAHLAVEQVVVAGSEAERLCAQARHRAAVAQSSEPLVNEHAAGHGDYREVEFVDDQGMIGKARRKSERVLRNFGATVVDRWMDEGGPGFEEPQRRAIDHCRALWRAAGGPQSLVANLDRVRGGDTRSGWAQQEALDALSQYKGRVPAAHWNVFENCVRWEEPAGTAGSSHARNPAQAIAAARTIVGFVGSLIAMWERF